MRLTKATVVATGAVAAFAVMGSAPALAASGQVTKAATTFGQVHQDSQAAPVSADGYGRDGGPSWGAPWQPAPLLSVLDDSVVNAAPWQLCGSTTVAGVGGAVPILSPNTVLGDCNNANTVLIAH